MNSDSDGRDSAPEMPAQPPTKTALFVDVLKATYLPLLFGVLCFVGLIALWWHGVPWRPLSIALLIGFVVGPFAACYTFLFSWMVQRRGSIPVLLVDDEGRELGMIYFTRNEFAEVNVEGGKLGTRNTRVGTAYLAEDYRIEQRERVDPDTGETESYAQPVLSATWEGEVETLEVIERWKKYHKQRDRLVPLAKEAVQVRADSDTKLMENTVRATHGVLLGAERDTFFDSSGDPLEWDTDVDMREMDRVTGAYDQDGEEREETPEPGSRSLQDLGVDGIDLEEPADD